MSDHSKAKYVTATLLPTNNDIRENTQTTPIYTCKYMYVCGCGGVGGWMYGRMCYVRKLVSFLVLVCGWVGWCVSGLVCEWVGV